MSASIVGFEQVFQSPLNTSKSKALYSFPRSQRFKSGFQGNCQQAFYDLPTQTSKRKAGIGYSNKYDFTNLGKNSPAPNSYQIHTFTEFNKTKNKGYSFGLGRELLLLSSSNKKTPGPGTYDQRSQLSRTAYSMRVKTASFLQANSKTPGPGAYEYLPTLNDKGRYTQSKFHNSGASTMNPPSSKRFGLNPYQRAVPGPGTYHPKNDMGNNGSYILSKYRSLIGKSFPHQNRAESQQSARITPGPGTYRMPSDFGHYESQKK